LKVQIGVRQPASIGLLTSGETTSDAAKYTPKMGVSDKNGDMRGGNSLAMNTYGALSSAEVIRYRKLTALPNNLLMNRISNSLSVRCVLDVVFIAIE
jgi:hypothetical protein